MGKHTDEKDKEPSGTGQERASPAGETLQSPYQACIRQEL